jgi:hypothetical protein
VGRLLAEPATAHALSVAGAAFDLSIVPLLLWRRSRPFAWLALVGFHVATWSLFPIGVFPWLMIGASTVFFAPDWPRHLWSRARTGGRWGPFLADNAPRFATIPRPTARTGGRWGPFSVGFTPRFAMVVAGVWVAVMLALPLRHLAYPGDHRWTGEGYRFAWNVLLTEKSGSVSFLVVDPATGRSSVADAGELYTDNQLRAMATEPDLIHQAARAIAAEERAAGHDVEVHVDAWVSLNGRPAHRLIDPTVDLAAQPRDIWSDAWILPLRD